MAVTTDITSAIVIIDNSQPYFFLNEDNNVQFYVQNLSVDISSISADIVLRNAVSGKELYNTQWTTQKSPLTINTISNENIAQISEAYNSISGPYYCTINLQKLGLVPTNDIERKAFLQYPLILTIALRTGDGTSTSNYSNGVMKSIIAKPEIDSYFTIHDSRIELEKIDQVLLYPDNYYCFNFKYIADALDTDTLLSASYKLLYKNNILQNEEQYFNTNTQVWSIPIKANLLEKAIDSNENSMSLQFVIDFVTVKGYSDTKTYTATINYIKEDFFDELFKFTKIIANPNSNKGVNQIEIIIEKDEVNNTDSRSLTGHLQLFRRDLTAKRGWELVQEISATLNGTNKSQVITLEDLIAEPGKPYLYSIAFYRQYFDGSTQSWITKYLQDTKTTQDPVILLTDDIFLITKKGILRIAYNPELTQYKRNMVDQITTTIGGAYPFVTRNGKQKHRTFSLGGLLSYNREKAQLYEAKEIKNYDSFVGNNEAYLASSAIETIFTQLPDSEHYKHLSNMDKEILYEKEFREKAMDFLYSDDIILFKSMQEGNIIVRLTGVSMTPNAQLSRNIYSFTSQAVEVMDNSVENCYNYFVTHADDVIVIYNDLYIQSVLGAAETLNALEQQVIHTAQTETDTIILYQDKEA